MSSKVGQNQQQGRRTPLSLTGSVKHAQPQQHQSNKTNSNLTKIQELKSDATATAAEAAVTKNGNNNAVKNQELNNLTQKEIKKAAQQNGNEKSNDVIIILDDIADSTKNGTANGHKTIKNNVGKTETTKEKDNKDTETYKDKPKKSETAKQTEDKKQNKTVEEPKEQVTPAPTDTTGSTKSKDGKAATTLNATTNENKTSTGASKSNVNANVQKPATPTKANERGTATPPAKSLANKSGTPSKSPRQSAAKGDKIEKESPAEDMMPLVLENSSPKKAAVIEPTATSTPGKVSSKRSPKNEMQNKTDNNSGSPVQSAIPRVYSQISGRRSIRQLDDYTPNKYNSQFRESYRRINTELDVTGNTNTSMNVTVGSEIPNNSSYLSFSFFGRGRKRERTPPPSLPKAKSQSAVELTTETTPPKRARLDVNGIITVMSSPLTLLRSRFSKATLDGSTPTKPKDSTVTHAEDDVQNVSGVSIEEVVCNSENSAEVAKEEQNNITVGKEATAEEKPNKKSSPSKIKKADKENDIVEPAIDKANESKDASAMDVDSDIQMKETPIIGAVGELKTKQRGCTIM